MKDMKELMMFNHDNREFEVEKFRLRDDTLGGMYLSKDLGVGLRRRDTKEPCSPLPQCPICLPSKSQAWLWISYQ